LLVDKVLGQVAAALGAERERWFLWLPVGLAAGIAGYFSLSREPERWTGPAALAVCLMAAVILRHRPAGWMAAAAAGAVALGFVAAVERSVRVAHPVLAEPSGVIRLSGRIAELEPLEQGLRVVLDPVTLPPSDGGSRPPTRVRLHLAGTEADLASGQWITVGAALFPPPAPAAPGAYDFTRQAWFARLGAVGYAVGAPAVLSSPDAESLGERLRLWLAGLRHELTRRIVGAIDAAGLPSGTGAVAAALITAERGPLPPAVLQSYRDAGLAHVLVIAGMHMSMVAGLVFVALRSILAAIPAIALRFSIKKLTAAGALLVTLGYLLISGAPVPTQRAFIMNGIVLLAVLVDRQAISLRSITWAALTVLLLQPEALVGASFQMSFAAVYGLISAYEALGPGLAKWRQANHGWWSTPLLYVAGIVLTTQIAGTATAFYTVFHFNRYATYSLLGNLLAVPVVGFWIMPAALLAFCLMPFGLDAWGWQLMGWGIVCVSRIARAVSSLPFATIDLPSIPVAALLVFTLGGCWLCLWRTRWRLLGVAGLAGGLALYVVEPPPDVLVDSAGRLMAVRSSDGRLALSGRHGAKMVRETWIKRAGQGSEAPAWDQLADDRLRCGRQGCLYRAHGHLVALAPPLRTLADACRTADVVVTPAPVRAPCPSARVVIDGDRLMRRGTHAVWLDDDGDIRVETVAGWQGDRPWSHRPADR
jgi:competence protein ComEC